VAYREWLLWVGFVVIVVGGVVLLWNDAVTEGLGFGGLPGRSGTASQYQLATRGTPQYRTAYGPTATAQLPSGSSSSPATPPVLGSRPAPTQYGAIPSGSGALYRQSEGATPLYGSPYDYRQQAIDQCFAYRYDVPIVSGRQVGGATLRGRAITLPIGEGVEIDLVGWLQVLLLAVIAWRLGSIRGMLHRR